MSQKIVVISGRKQSGKNSAFNYLTGYLMKQAGLIEKFALDKDGKLLINALVQDPSTGQMTDQMGVLDVNRNDNEYVRYAERNIWPLCRPYHFADVLKEVVAVVFQTKIEELNGTDEDKNRPTQITWGFVYKLLRTPKPKQDKLATDFMTNRQLLEVFGTDICRTLYDNCWVESCFKRIVNDGLPLAIVCDGRFPGEMEYAKELGAITVRLTRNPLEGGHEAETALNDYDRFDHVIDNVNMTQEEKGVEFIKILQAEGIVN